MKKKSLPGLLLITILVVLPFLCSCTPESTPTPTASTPTPAASTPTPAADADWWDKFGEPQYGGSITISATRQRDGVDPNNPFTSCDMWTERLFAYDWTLPRDTKDHMLQNFTEDNVQGWLVEDWEWQDSQTLVLHMREGVYWQDKPPANGREFTAYDVQFHYDRVLGTGSGFSEPNPYCAGWIEPIERVTALDDDTAIMIFKRPTLLSNFKSLFEVNWIENPDLVKEYGAIEDWTLTNTTGPFVLKDFVKGVSITMERNPNYWGYDERYPENQLPYADEWEQIIIIDTSTSIAALKTGKINYISQLSYQQGNIALQTDPDLQYAEVPTSGLGVEFRCDHEPFTDINVRKALQLAIDRELIAQTFYGGVVDGKPAGLISPEYAEWTVLYDDWPEDLKAEYDFDPEKAQQMLADAGYPDGFETSIVADNSNQGNVEVLEIVKAMFLDVGVDMTIDLMDRASAENLRKSRMHEQLSYYNKSSQVTPIGITLYSRTSENIANYICVVDPVYDTLYEDFQAANSWEEAKGISKEAVLHDLRQHYQVVIPGGITYTLWSPYLMGFSGDYITPSVEPFTFPRLWIDSTLKESLGE